MIKVMARKASLVTTDDLDGSPGTGTVPFGLDGVTCEIDLAPADKTRLAETVAPYIAAGRKASRASRRCAGQPAGGGRVDRAAVRAWAQEPGPAISGRGRISTEAMSQYEAAQLASRSPNGSASRPSQVTVTERDSKQMPWLRPNADTLERS
jgi:hypothetical protein